MPVKESASKENTKVVFILAVPISILAGFLGIGPGFLLVPTLILFGFKPKRAAGINAFSATPASFSVFIPHLSTAQIDLKLAIPLFFVGALGTFGGAGITSNYVSNERLAQIFGTLIILVTLCKISTLIKW